MLCKDTSTRLDTSTFRLFYTVNACIHITSIYLTTQKFLIHCLKPESNLTEIIISSKLTNMKQRMYSIFLKKISIVKRTNKSFNPVESNLKQRSGFGQISFHKSFTLLLRTPSPPSNQVFYIADSYSLVFLSEPQNILKNPKVLSNLVTAL